MRIPVFLVVWNEQGDYSIRDYRAAIIMINRDEPDDFTHGKMSWTTDDFNREDYPDWLYDVIVDCNPWRLLLVYYTGNPDRCYPYKNEILKGLPENMRVSTDHLITFYDYKNIKKNLPNYRGLSAVETDITLIYQ
jgi:hypothetical protein